MCIYTYIYIYIYIYRERERERPLPEDKKFKEELEKGCATKTGDIH